MIKLENFSICFKDKTLLKDVDTSFQSHCLTSLIGRNGSGKSTLLKAMCGLSEDYKGNILIDGENIKKLSHKTLASKIAYVNTRRPRLANLKCHEVVALGRAPYTNWNGKLTGKDQKRIKEAFEMVNMSDYYSRHFNTLSDGESQKIMIARAIAQDTEIILLDEPTSFLDLPTRYELVKLLKYLAHDFGKTIVFSTHELDIALKYSDFICLFNSPSLLNLPSEEMMKSPVLSSLFPSISF